MRYGWALADFCQNPTSPPPPLADFCHPRNLAAFGVQLPLEDPEVPPEYLTPFLEEARARGDLNAVARVARAYRKAPLEAQEEVRALLERYAILDQEGEGPLDGVYALGWRE